MFGVVTRVLVRLTKAPEAYKTMLGVFETVDDASQTVSDIIAAGIVPGALEMMDQLITQAVEAAYKFGFPLDAGAVLIIELDGESHDFEERQKADQSRDAFFESEGLQVLRLANEQVLSNLEAVVEIIRQTAASRICGPPPSAAIAARAPTLTLPRERGRGQDLSAGKRSS